ncbi:MAG: hypothetical protein ABIK62_02700, partial [candidate division WOR-3 bacterium]
DYYVPASDEYIELMPNVVFSSYAVAVSFTYNNGTDTVGGRRWYNPATGESLLVLKLLKPLRSDSMSRTWNLELRNIYKVGGAQKNVRLDTVRLIRHAPGDPEQGVQIDERGSNFLQLVGLDPDGDGTVTWPQFDR